MDIKITHMLYTPRDTKYRILAHNLKIKDSKGYWNFGCSYVGEDDQIYVRPYDMFDETKWVFAEVGE